MRKIKKPLHPITESLLLRRPIEETRIEAEGI